MRYTFLLIVAAAWALAQAPLAFEAASIRPSTEAERPAFSIQPGGSLVVTGEALKPMIQQAYDIPGFFVSGGPTWIGIDRYDISAKAGDPASSTERTKQRLQTLLATRFQLKLHRETREIAGYALVAAKSGPKLAQASGGDERIQMSGGSRDAHQHFLGGGRARAQNATMTMLADSLTRNLGVPVLDRTGLPGKYDFTLEWTPDGPDSSAPLLSVIQSQLGLRLEPAKVPVETIVIDSAQRPMPD